MRGLAVALLAAVVAGCRDREASPRALFLADSLKLEGRYAEAMPRYAALLDSLSVVGDSTYRWRAQIGWAETLLRTGRLDSARVALDSARSMAGNDTQRAARTRYVRSLLLHRQGKLDSALAEAGAAMEMSRTINDVTLEVDAQSARATVYSLSGRYRLAAAQAESALANERRLNRQPQFLVQRLNNLGVEYRHLGRVADAERVLGEALQGAERLPSPRWLMLVSGNFSNVRRSAGRVTEALAFSERAESAAQSLNDLQGLVMNAQDLGSSHMSLGNHAAAKRYYERSIAANTPVRYAYGRIGALHGLGRIETAEGRPAVAIRHLRQAIAAADSGRFGQERVLVRASLAHAVIAAGDAREGLRWADAALALSDSVGDLQARLRAQEARAAALEAIGRGREAAGAYIEAIDLLESWRGRIELGDLRMGVADPYWGVYEGAIRTLVSAGDVDEAFAVGERARARRLLELMAQRDASRPSVERDDVLRTRIRVLAEERGGARSDSIRAERDRDIAAAIDSLERYQRQLANTPAGAARLPVPRPLGVLRAELTKPGQTLVAFFWGEQDVYGWLVTPDVTRASRLGSTASIGTQVDFLRATLESPSTAADWSEPARRAYASILAPLELPPSSDLLIIPDGPLAHVPFETLLPPGDRVPLGASRRIAYGPSASVLYALARRGPSSTSRALLAVGNPALVTHQAGTDGATGRSSPLGSLPHAESEARAVHTLFREQGADLLVGRRATKKRWLDLSPERYRYLHFAAHAEVSDQRPERTRVLLADAPLDLEAIRALDLNAELVTLSACETALGQRVRGEGVIGLPHAFLSAGAGAVLVTLWRVDDRATAAFMEDFYREVHAGESPAEALRIARARRVGASGEHPAYWAPFVLVGVL
jgi:CHAT domain-containing protein/tetratricopeptide (TPR) repeat protein